MEELAISNVPRIGWGGKRTQRWPTACVASDVCDGAKSEV